jgi:hypothetical protein
MLFQFSLFAFFVSVRKKAIIRWLLYRKINAIYRLYWSRLLVGSSSVEQPQLPPQPTTILGFNHTLNVPTQLLTWIDNAEILNLRLRKYFLKTTMALQTPIQQ